MINCARIVCFLALASVCFAIPIATQAATIIDHTQTNINALSQADVLAAKQNLHIAYGHTSHGSQIVSGMSGLNDFMNLKKSDAFDDNTFTFNETGSGGALRFHDYAFDSYGGYDLGNPDRSTWATATRDYLQDHPDTNVVMWSWCGQADGSAEQIQDYLDLMTGLESDYPKVSFVYMTGHLVGSGATGNLNLRNQQIRDYCTANNKILFDFADIESYDPDHLVNYMQLDANDNCDYDSDGNGSLDRNWALDWQGSHTENVDWYDCGAAHSQSLNANMKAYAAWTLWTKIATVPEPNSIVLFVTGLLGLAAYTCGRKTR